MIPNIILASASPRREALLGRVIDDFKVIPSNAAEQAPDGRHPAELAMANALAKALDVASNHPHALVIGADTVVVLDGTIMGKPRDRDHAIEMLSALSGTVHAVITGVALVHAEEKLQLTGHELTEVTFKRLSEVQIARYVDEKMPLDKAGAYGIQELGEGFVESVDGDYENVVGLPLELVSKRMNNIKQIVEFR